MTVRKIPRKSRSLSGLFPSTKNGRQLAFESALERDLFLLLEFSPEVRRFEEQPVRIVVQHPDGREGTYVPDVLVGYHDASRPEELLEVKYEETLRTDAEELAPVFESANCHAQQNGLKFRVLTERDIRTPYLRSAKFLLPYRDHVPNTAVIDALHCAISLNGPLIVSALISAASVATSVIHAKVLPVVWHLVACFELTVDLDRPLTMESVISQDAQILRTPPQRVQ